MRFTLTHQTHVGKVREINQDALFTDPVSGLLIMADGMGGEKAGEEASAQVIATLTRTLEPVLATADLEPETLIQQLTDGLLGANSEVQAIGREDPAKKGLGSTASVLVLHKGLATLAHVGDSRIYMLRQGQVRQLTRDHSVVWLMYERGTITRRQLETHPERHLLTQCIGDPRPISVETLQIPVEPGDLFLLCSDGLTGYAPEPAIFSMLLHPELTLEEQGVRLLDMALHGGGGDNISLILARVEELDPEDDWQPTQNTTTQTAPPPPLAADSMEETVEELASPQFEQLNSGSTAGAAWEEHQKKLEAAQRRFTIAAMLLMLLGLVMLVLWSLGRL